MKNTLDAKMPVSKPTNWNKWFLGGAAITVIAVSTYFIIQNKEGNKPISTQTTEEIKSNTKQKQVAKNSQFRESQKTSELNGNVVQNSKETESSQVSFNENSSLLTPNNTLDLVDNNDQNITDSDNNNSANNLNIKQSNNEMLIREETNGSSNSSNSQVATVISVRDLCVGENQTIENKNTFDINLIQQSNKKVVAIIKSKQSFTFQAQEAGIYELTTKSLESDLNSNTFEVKKATKPVFTLESEVLYVKGVPTIKASSENTVNSIWKVNGKMISQNQSDIEFNPYFAGKYTVSLSCNDNGCVSTSEESVQISEDYKLLAPNAFNPNSFDIKNQTFMPFALTQRDVKFTMIILDPKNGGLLYETDDASQPWTGIDKRNGQMTPSNQVYIWKVKIQNPLPGEPNEYKGTITKL
jgi:hypothetical protein